MRFRRLSVMSFPYFVGYVIGYRDSNNNNNYYYNNPADTEK